MRQMMLRTYVSEEVALRERVTLVGMTDVPMSVYGFNDEEVALLLRRLTEHGFLGSSGCAYYLRHRNGDVRALHMSTPTCDVSEVRNELLAWVRRELAFEAELNAAIQKHAADGTLREMLVVQDAMLPEEGYPEEAIPRRFMVSPKSPAGQMARLRSGADMEALMEPVIRLADEEENARARAAYLACSYKRLASKRGATPRVYEPYIQDEETLAHAKLALENEEKARWGRR
jgi:hypothetical protein